MSQMKLATVLRRFVRDEPTLIYECRHCGHTVDEETEDCPECETDGIAEYRV